MRIPRKAIYIKAIGLTDTSAHKKGDIIHFMKIRGVWHSYTAGIGDDYVTFISTIRNDNYYKILEIMEDRA